MLLLVTIGLVVVGAVALVVGFISNSLGPIYISIACSVIAGVVLVVFSRMARRGDAGGSAIAGPASASPGSWSPAAATPPPVTIPTPSPTAGFHPPPAPSPPPPPPVRRREPEPTITMDQPVREDEAFKAPAPAAAMLDGDDDFPIAGYDKLRSSEIVAQLADLDLDELDMVQEREEQTKNRATVLRQVVIRIDALEAEEADGTPAAPEPAPVVDDFPAAAPHEFPADDDGFPIADYDQLSVDEVIAVLDDLEDEELDMVAEREEMGQNRAEILDYIDDMFEEVAAGAPEPARAAAAAATAPPAPRSAAKKTPAKKVAAKKVAVKKAAPAGRRPAAAPVAKAPARKATATKVTSAKAVPAKATAASAASSPGAKSAGRRTAASPASGAAAGATKKAATKRAPAKKAAAATRKR